MFVSTETTWDELMTVSPQRNMGNTNKMAEASDDSVSRSEILAQFQVSFASCLYIL